MARSAVLPARAGMSPIDEGTGDYRISAPRASGDEPLTTQTERKQAKCSPRERG